MMPRPLTLADLLRGPLDPEHGALLADVLTRDDFHPAAHLTGLPAAEQDHLTYERLRALLEALPPGRDLLADPALFFSLVEHTTVVDSSLALALIVQCGLGLGSLLELGKGRDDLTELTRQVERCETYMSFAVTELGYGNSHLGPTTEAHFDPETGGFILHTPDDAARKFMTNIGADHQSKTAVVMAKLLVRGQDCGAHQFIVPLTGAHRPSGISRHCLPPTPVVPLDYGLLSFDHTPLPFTAWLHDGATINAAGNYHDPQPNPAARLARSLAPARNVWGGFPSALAAVCRASASTALRYSQTHTTLTLGDTARRPLLDHHTQQDALLGALATAFVITCATDHTRRNRIKAMTDPAPAPISKTIGRAMTWSPWAALDRETGIIKAMAAWTAEKVASECRRRCGASGVLTTNTFLAHQFLGHAFNHAAGDNNLIALDTARALVDGIDYTPPVVDPAHHKQPITDPRRWLALHRAQENALRDRIAAGIRSTPGTNSPYEKWNPVQHLCRALGEAYGRRRIVEITLDTIATVPDASDRAQATALLTLHVLHETTTHLGLHLADSLLSADEAHALPTLVSDLSAHLMEELSELLDTFAFPAGLHRAPALADDYPGALVAASQHITATE